jgi:DNA recombination protein RmuC
MLLIVSFIALWVVAAAVAAGLVSARFLARSLADQAEVDRQATLEATRAVLAEASAEASADRDTVVRAAVESVVSVAGDKLRRELDAGSEVLDVRAQAFEERVGAMSEGLERVTTLVGELQRDRASQHGQLVERLEATVKGQADLAETTGHLRQALASPKARGQWGERMADDVLRLAGMAEGVNYRKQTALAGGTIPDFTFVMPQNLSLNMDVKFPVDNYLRYLEAESDDQRDGHAKAFVRDVRSRLKEITTRDYIDAETTVNCVLLFIPNESIYSFIHEHDPQLTDHALENRVVLCSPFTLFAVLGVIRQSVDSFLLQRTSDDILDALGGFRQEWDKFSDQLDKVGKQFDTAHKSYEALSGTRRRVLERQLDRVDDLRRRSHDLDDLVLDDPADDDPADEPTRQHPSVPYLREVNAG